MGSTSSAMRTSWAFFFSMRAVMWLMPNLTAMGFLEGSAQK